MSFVTLIAAMDPSRAIGKNGGLPWKNIPGDLEHFRETTRGKPVVMGRNTWLSLPVRPLPKRRNIVLSNAGPVDGAETCSSVQETLDLLKNEPEIMVIGGGMVYTAFLPFADRLLLSEVKEYFGGDVFFPAIGPEFEVFSKEDRGAFWLVEYRRKQ